MTRDPRNFPAYADDRPLKRPCVAITGGIGEGKSTALKILEELGYRVTSADEVAKGVMADPSVREALAKNCGLECDFSPECLRRALALSQQARDFTQAILHPLIWAGMQKTEAQFYEVPLLFENFLEFGFDESWLIWCPDEVKEERLKARYGGSVGAELERVQMGRTEKMRLATKHFRSDVPLLVEKAELQRAAEAFFGNSKQGE